MPDRSQMDHRLASIANSLDNITMKLQGATSGLTNAAVLGGIGYGGYKVATSNSVPAQLARGAGSNLAGGVQAGAETLNVTPGSWHNTLGHRATSYTGINDQGNIAMYHGGMDIANKVGTNFSSTGLAIGGMAAGGLAAKAAGSVFGGVTGGIGSMVGSGAVKGTAGLTSGILGAAGIPGASKVGNAIGLLNKPIGLLGGKGIVPALTGAIGSAIPGMAAGLGVTKFAGEMAKNIGAQRDVEDLMRDHSFRITPGMSTNPITREGFGYDDQRRFAENARGNLNDELYLRQGDFEDIFGSMLENNMLFDVRGREDLEERFKEVTENVKDITRFYNTTLEGAVELMAEMQDAGFFETQQQVDALMHSRIIGRMSGMTGQEVVQMGKQGSAMARQMGLNPTMGYQVQTGVTYDVVGAERQMTEEQRQRYLEDIELAGGREEVIGQIAQHELSWAQRSDMKTMLFGLIDPEGEGFDENMLRAFRDGNLNYQDMLDQGLGQMSRGTEEWLDYSQNFHRYYDELTQREDYREMARAFVEAIEEVNFGDSDIFGIREALQSLGVTDGRMRDIMIDMYENKPSGLALEVERMRSIEAEERMRKVSIQENLEQHLWSPIKDAAYGFSQWGVDRLSDVKQWTEDFQMGLAGYSRLDQNIGITDTNLFLDKKNIRQGINEGLYRTVDNIDDSGLAWRPVTTKEEGIRYHWRATRGQIAQKNIGEMMNKENLSMEDILEIEETTIDEGLRSLDSIDHHDFDLVMHHNNEGFGTEGTKAIMKDPKLSGVFTDILKEVDHSDLRNTSLERKSFLGFGGQEAKLSNHLKQQIIGRGIGEGTEEWNILHDGLVDVVGKLGVTQGFYDGISGEDLDLEPILGEVIGTVGDVSDTLEYTDQLKMTTNIRRDLGEVYQDASVGNEAKSIERFFTKNQNNTSLIDDMLRLSTKESLVDNLSGTVQGDFLGAISPWESRSSALSSDFNILPDDLIKKTPEVKEQILGDLEGVFDETLSPEQRDAILNSTGEEFEQFLGEVYLRSSDELIDHEIFSEPKSVDEEIETLVAEMSAQQMDRLLDLLKETKIISRDLAASKINDDDFLIEKINKLGVSINELKEQLGG